LVSVVLLGLGGASTLNALGSSVLSSRLERDHSRAQVWLQSAIEVLQAKEREGCDQGEAVVRANYQQWIRDNVTNPPGWSDSQLTIRTPIRVWDGTTYWDPYDPEAPKPCFDNDGFELQLITIVVTSPEGDIIEDVTIVKAREDL
jgi:hypothetical protein